MKEFMLFNSEGAVGPSTISAFEKSLGFTLPRVFIDLYINHNGGEPSRSWVITGDGYDPMQVVDFKPLLSEGPKGSSDTKFVEGCYKVMTERQVIPHTLLPFAVDGGGNFFCLDLLSGVVVFYAVDSFREEMSMVANQIAVQKVIARTFEGFIDELEEDPDF